MRPAATDCRMTSEAAGWQPTTLISPLTDFASAAMPVTWHHAHSRLRFRA